MHSATPRLFPFAPLAGSLLLVLAPAIAGSADESAVAAPAATITVTNCNDSGPGSLRDAVGYSGTGNTISLASLGCSRILLTSGQINVPQDDLDLVGRGRRALTIDGNFVDSIFRHSGTGTLRLRRMTIANGKEVNDEGGCVYSQGNVKLIHARVSQCEASRDGGGIRANTVVLDHSRVDANNARAGGGIYAGSVTASYSVIHGNLAEHGGGILVGCPEGCGLTLRKSTVSGNVSSSIGGGFDSSAADSTLIVDSTISDNAANDFSAGSLSSDTRIFNSTIAFNLNTGQFCIGAINDRARLRIVSSIVSRNTCAQGGEKDIGVYDGAQVMGSNNIIGVSDVPVPADTIMARPRLGPLTNNGGPTPTRMPAADSPALDRGINPLNCQYDQRGPGFPRVKGGFPDIGAVER